mgnify:CR=1 FL=1
MMRSAFPLGTISPSELDPVNVFFSEQLERSGAHAAAVVAAAAVLRNVLRFVIIYVLVLFAYALF